MLLVIALLLTNIYHPQNYDGLLYLFPFFSLSIALSYYVTIFNQARKQLLRKNASVY